MTDGLNISGYAAGGAFDDDRLLACALGLDDDPELLAAAAADAALAARLDAVRADVAAVGAQVAAAVPEPEDDYADLSGERWGGLKEYFEVPASAAKPRRAGRWWRVAAPVAALAVLALVVGIVAVGGDSQTGVSSLSGQAAEVDRAASGATPETTGDKALGSVTAAERLASQLDRFAVVVLARAQAAKGALQEFAVLRIFKGDAPHLVELAVGTQPADRGRLHLLMLDPLARESTPPSPSPSVVVSPSPAVSFATPTYEASLLGEELDVAYTYLGEATMVREFPAGTDPSTVSLTIP